MATDTRETFTWDSVDPVAWDSYDGIRVVVVGDSKTDVLLMERETRVLLAVRPNFG